MTTAIRMIRTATNFKGQFDKRKEIIFLHTTYEILFVQWDTVTKLKTKI